MTQQRAHARNWRDRIKEFRRIPSETLKANPKNWRTHNNAQRRALNSVLGKVGFAGAVIAYENSDKELIIIDGHLRVSEANNEEIPVIILDVNDNEADILLATYDPIGTLANSDNKQIDTLLEQIDNNSNELQDLLEDIQQKYGSNPLADFDADNEWDGMPEFISNDENAVRDIIVHFTSDEDVKKFAELVNQNITDKTKFIWFPEQENSPMYEIELSNDG
jgi:hypothetical protein